IAKYELQSHQIHLEISESNVLRYEILAKDTLDQLHSIGLNITIDNFGSTFAGLSYLSNLPIKTVKIDRSYLQDFINKETNQHLIKSMIDLANNFKLNIVAEGIESEESEKFLRDLGCNLVQGYYYSQPTSLNNITPDL